MSDRDPFDLTRGEEPGDELMPVLSIKSGAASQRPDSTSLSAPHPSLVGRIQVLPVPSAGPAATATVLGRNDDDEAAALGRQRREARTVAPSASGSRAGRAVIALGSVLAVAVVVVGAVIVAAHSTGRAHVASSPGAALSAHAPARSHPSARQPPAPATPTPAQTVTTTVVSAPALTAAPMRSAPSRRRRSPTSQASRLSAPAFRSRSARPPTSSAFKTGFSPAAVWAGTNTVATCSRDARRFFEPGYRANLLSSWIPALDGVDNRLQTGGRVADVGCGHVASTIIIAEGHPGSAIIGFDYDEDSIAHAQRRAREASPSDRLRFAVADGFPGTGYDLVTCFACLHDIGDTVSRHVRGALGAQAGEAGLREALTAGGFTRVRRAAGTPFNSCSEPGRDANSIRPGGARHRRLIRDRARNRAHAPPRALRRHGRVQQQREDPGGSEDVTRGARRAG